jgi:hypothetical protein
MAAAAARVPLRAGARPGRHDHGHLDRLRPGDADRQPNETVVWTNADTADHQLVSDRRPCLVTVLHTGRAYSFTFAKDGKFTIKDAMNKSFRALVTVQRTPAPASAPKPAKPNPAPKPTVQPNTAVTAVTLRPAGLGVVFGGTTALAGAAGSQAGLHVDVMAQAWGEKSFHRIATVTTTAGGHWSYAAGRRPTMYQAHVERLERPGRDRRPPRWSRSRARRQPLLDQGHRRPLVRGQGQLWPLSLRSG